MASVVLSSTNQTSGWFDLSGLVRPASFIVSGAGTWTLVTRYSNNPAVSKGTDYVTDATTLTTPDGPFSIDPGVTNFVQFAFSSFGSGSATVSWGKGQESSGRVAEIDIQTTKTTPPVST